MEEEAGLFYWEGIDDEPEEGEDLPHGIPAEAEGPAISDPEDSSEPEPVDGPGCSCGDRRQPEERARDWPSRGRSLRAQHCCYRLQGMDTPEYPEDTEVAASAAGSGLLGSTAAAAAAASAVAVGICRTVLPVEGEGTAEGGAGRTDEGVAPRRTVLPAAAWAAWAASGEESEGSTQEGNQRTGALQ